MKKYSLLLVIILMVALAAGCGLGRPAGKDDPPAEKAVLSSNSENAEADQVSPFQAGEEGVGGLDEADDETEDDEEDGELMQDDELDSAQAPEGTEGGAVTGQSAGATATDTADNLDEFPLPVLPGWHEHSFTVRQYEEGTNWLALFTYDNDPMAEGAKYQALLAQRGYRPQAADDYSFTLTTQIAGKTFAGSCVFAQADEFDADFDEGQAFAECGFQEQ